jgi:excisionase family DNA binding protein
MNTSTTYETIRLSEAARVLGVGDTTLKRWTEEGRIACERTAGGHRRFRRDVVAAFRARMSGERPAAVVEAPDRGVDSRTWLDEPGDPAEPTAMSARLLALRATSDDWAEAADRLCAGLLSEIGERWAQGRLTCAEEHALSRSVESALIRVAHAMPVAPDAPVMVLACPAGERHTLGLSLVETAVRERGMAIRYLGADVPTGDIVKVVKSVRPVAVGLSASRHPRPASELLEPARVVAQACAEVGARLFLGGGGNWPAVRGAQRALTIMDVVRALAPVLPRPAPR